MRPYALLLCLLTAATAAGQDPITAANKCYDEKNYECAVGKYKEAIADKKYVEKDYPEIKYRIAYGLAEMKKFQDAEQQLKELLAFKPGWGKALWEMGWIYYSLQEYQKGSDYYGQAIEQYKGDTANLKFLYFWRGKCLAALKKYTEASEAYSLAIAIDSSNDSYYASSGDAFYNGKKYTEAATAYRKSIAKTEPGSAYLASRYYWLGKSEAALYKYDDALISYGKALALEPENRNAIWGIAGIFYDQKKYKDAIEYYSKAIPYYKSDSVSLSNLYYWRGRSYLGLNDIAKASADYDLALKADKWHEAAYWQKASLLKNQKKYKEAIPFYDEAIELYLDLDDSSMDDLYFFRGFCYFQLKDTVQAERDFRLSIEKNKNLSDPYIFMGHISYGRKNYFDAKTHYAMAVAGYKTDSAQRSIIYLRKGVSNLMLGEAYYYTAKEDLLKSISFDSLNKEAHRFLADVYYRQSNFVAAEKQLDKCIEFYKKDKDSLPVMYLYRGMARAQQKKFKEALADYEQSDKLLPMTNPENIKYMGQLAYDQKEFEKVTKIFTRLITTYKPAQRDELLYAYFVRGCAAVESKKKADAIKDLKKALELSPGHKDITSWMTKAEALP